MKKICRICGLEKSINDFYERAKRCKNCISLINKKRIRENHKPIINLIGEFWVDSEKHKGYSISNKSRIKSFDKSFENIRIEYLLKPGYANGYKRIELNGKAYQWHRIVAETFIPNPDNKPYINHKNGIKDDNRIENLEWCTQSENVKHSFLIGTQNNKGENHPRHIITLKQSKEIKLLLKKGGPRGFQRMIANKYGVSVHLISKIKHGKLWNY